MGKMKVNFTDKMNVVGPCMGWVPMCWRELLGLFRINTKVDDDTLLDLTVSDKPGLPDLPNSVIENILSRLSPKCIFRCQRDSKALQVLTKTRYFIRMQHNRSSPVIIQQFIPRFVSDGNMELYFIEAESHNVERIFFELDSYYMQKDNPLLLLGSYDGFLLFTNSGCSMYMQGPPVFYVWNPITNQKVTFRPPNSRLHVCAFYFCSLRREYVLLFFSNKGAPFKFKMYIIGTKSWENVGNFPYPPNRDRPPVILNKTLYWVVDQCFFFIENGGKYPSRSHFVLSFDFETKKFGTIGHDGLAGMSERKRFRLNVHLFELEEELYICDFAASTKLELSVLNQGTKCWVKKHTVILPMDDFHIRKRPYGSTGRWVNKFIKEVFPYKKGELLVRDDERLLIYDIRSNTCRLVGNKGRPEDSSNFQIAVHNYSLVSF